MEVTPAGDKRLFAVGETVQLTATPRNSAGAPVSATVTWSSTNTGVATVSSTGLVTATGFGSAIIRATAGSVFRDVSVLVQAAATTVSFNVNADQPCTGPLMAPATLEATSEHLLIYADVNNPANGFTAADYEAFAATFESLIWPVLTENFGTPTDIDNNGRVIALFTRAVNQLTPSGSTGVVGGFFFGRDLFPKLDNDDFEGCPASNVAEMFYLLVPDPTGSINGNTRTVTDVARITTGVIGHEMQHLINSARRLYINPFVAGSWPETVYMEEGLSHIAEEMLFYEASTTALPRMNLGISEIQDGGPRLAAFNSYMSSNSGRISLYLKAPSANAPYKRADNLETRGAAWSFLRYLADRGAPGTPQSPSEPACASPVLLTAVGQRCRIDGAAAASFDVSSASGIQEFAIVAFAADLPSTSPTQDGVLSNVIASAVSAVEPAGPPNPDLIPSGALLSTFGAPGIGPGAQRLELDHRFHDKLRARERRDLPRRVAAARAEYARMNLPGARRYTAGEAPSMAVTALEPIWAQLINTPDTGIVNLRNRFGSDITSAARDWAVANYVDDVGFSGIPAQYTHRSWNFRTLLPELNVNADKYPLLTHDLTTLAGPVTISTLTNGGAAYFRLAAQAGTTSGVTFTVNGAAPGNSLKLTVMRTK